MMNENEPIIVEQNFKTSVKNVWEAITEVSQMRQWFFKNIESFQPEVGFETQFNVKTPEREFMHLWKLIEVIPMQKITYNWKYENYPGDSTVTFELVESDKVTKLILTAIVVENFPNDIPEFKRESGVAGWNYFIKESLKNYLEGTEQ